jgi:hypothetical protein
MIRKIFLIMLVCLLGIPSVSCGGEGNDEFADAPVTAPADIAPDANQNLETAVTPETAP